MKVARKEALKNIREAIELYLEPIGDAQIPPPNTGQLN
jgi:predicted RNase H-like HicB family nuclease